MHELQLCRWHFPLVRLGIWIDASKMKSGNHVPLRTAITLPLILLFTCTAFMQLTFQRHGIEYLIEEENTYLLRQITTAVQIRLDHFLAAPVMAQRILSEDIHRQSFYIAPEAGQVDSYLLSTFANIFGVFPQVGALGFGDETGRHVDFRCNEKAQGCDRGQGYLFGYPGPFNELNSGYCHE